MKKCPFCREIIQDTAIKCRYCGEWLEKAEPSLSKDGPDYKSKTTPELPRHQSTIIARVETHEPKMKKIDNTEGIVKNKLFRWVIFIAGAIFIAFIFGIWKVLERKYLGYSLFSAFLRGAICGGGIFYLFYWARSNPQKAETENIIREAELKSAQGVPQNTPSKAEVKRQNEEFIELLKSTVKENGLNKIPGDDLIEIYNRAKSIAVFSSEQDMELSSAINVALEEIKKRRLSPDVKPHMISDYEVSSYTNIKSGLIDWDWGYAILGAGILVVAIVLIASFSGNFFGNAEKYFNKAEEYRQSGQYQKAVENYNKAINEKPDYISAYFNRGYAYAELGYDNQAIKDYDKVIELNPQEANAYNNRGIAYFAQGNNNLGCQDAQKACEMGVCKTLEWTKDKGYCGREEKNLAAVTEAANKTNNTGTKSCFDIIGFYNKHRDYYGDAPLDKVAKDIYTNGGFDKEYADFDTWKKASCIDTVIQEDIKRRTQ